MSTDPNADIAKQTTKGSLYSVLASGVTIGLGFLRMTLMLRLLEPAQFGVATLALFYLNLVGQLLGFGIDRAIIHHRNAGEIERSVYLTLKMVLAGLTALFSLLLIPLLAVFYPDEPELVPVLMAYAGISVVKSVNMVQVTLLSRNMAFRELSITDVASSVVMTIVAPTLAWMGFGVWSIVAEQLSAALSRLLLLWIPFRAWRPRFGWDSGVVRWFWAYGRSVWGDTNLVFLNDRFDDWYVGTFLGSAPLGYYSQAYNYARYPRKVIANPILLVFFPVYARLQDEKQRLSRAFLRATSVMLRAGGLLSLLMILTAPEFIPLLLGEKWLPMLLTFQLMVVYTLLDPLSLGASDMLLATGHSGVVMRIRVWQTLFFVPSVVILGSRLGIAGVALAANLMVLLGTLLLFRSARKIVSYSSRTLWLWPVVAMILTGGFILLATPLWESLPLLASFLLKATLIPLLYGGILWLAEREQLLAGRDMIWGLVRPMVVEKLPSFAGRRGS